MNPAQPMLYKGKVVHRRFRPRKHELCYRVFSLMLDLNNLPKLDKEFSLFSLNRFNLFSLYEKDHGKGTHQDLRDDIGSMISKAGFDPEETGVQMLFFPRLLGYAFNPLTVYFCRDSNDQLCLIIYQVDNTFGERQFYVLPVECNEGAIEQTCEKHLYVSPFNNIEGHYDFRLMRLDEELRLSIDLSVNGQRMMTAYHSARGDRLTDRLLFKSFLQLPFMTLKVIAGIHLEALLLWVKGMKVTKRVPIPSSPGLYIQKKQAGTGHDR